MTKKNEAGRDNIPTPEDYEEARKFGRVIITRTDAKGGQWWISVPENECAVPVEEADGT